MTDNRNKPPLDERQLEAEKILKRVQRDAESVGTSSVARVSKLESGEHETEDKVEMLARRTGRTLGWAALGVLVLYLVSTYIL